MMDSSTISLVTGLLGLLLGVISAYAQLKSFAKRMTGASVVVIQKLSDERKQGIRELAENPSALIAHIFLYLAICFVCILLQVFVAAELHKPLVSTVTKIWGAVSFVLGAALGGASAKLVFDCMAVKSLISKKSRDG